MKKIMSAAALTVAALALATPAQAHTHDGADTTAGTTATAADAVDLSSALVDETFADVRQNHIPAEAPGEFLPTESETADLAYLASLSDIHG
ncbi:hypothetical protein [Streptomyces sp. NPDC051211]|uniref:hypothetical protein n=1 Tax=Streptomyces sp. NPDC051211 TaxID=3154643 RepID=UPI00344D7915